LFYFSGSSGLSGLTKQTTPNNGLLLLARYFNILDHIQKGRVQLTAAPAPNTGQTSRYLFGCGV
jgi:hypothetical protein